MLKNLIKLADHLDRKGLAKEANFLDGIIKNAHEGHEDLSEYFKGDTVIDESGKPLFDLPKMDESPSQDFSHVLTTIRGLTSEEQKELMMMLVQGGPLSIG
jgi:hypothetical protein